MAAASLWLATAFAAPAFALDSGDITVSSLDGEVQVTMNGAARKVRVGSVLELPATVRTGRNGAIELRQGATSLAVGPETTLEFPALEKPGAPIDRVVQPRGNVFYDIGKREGRKLRVETPYLVGVVKGTQFNVAAQEVSTTISLFEGLLEIRATDESAVVDLEAGEIASRRRGEKTISVLPMDAGKTPTPGARPSASAGAGDPGDASLVALPLPAGDTHDAGQPDPHGVSLLDTSAVGADAVSVASVVGTDTAGDAGANAVSVGTDISVGAPVDLNANTAISLGTTPSVDVAANPGVDAGVASIGAATNVSLEVTPANLSVDAGIGAQLDAGPASVDVSTSSGVDLGAPGIAVDAGVATDVDARVISVSVDVGANVGVGADSIGATVDAGAALGGALGAAAPSIDAGLNTTVDVSTGAVDLGVSVGGLDVNVGLDLGLGGNEDATDTESSTTDTATDTGDTGTVDVGGLLDGLLRRPGRQ